MTKADIVSEIAKKTGVEKVQIQTIVEAFMEEVKESLKKQRDNGFKLYWIACGETDFLYQANKEAMKYMDSINFPYTYRESGEGHIWRNWRIYLSEFAPMLFK